VSSQRPGYYPGLFLLGYSSTAQGGGKRRSAIRRKGGRWVRREAYFWGTVTTPDATFHCFAVNTKSDYLAPLSACRLAKHPQPVRTLRLCGARRRYDAGDRYDIFHRVGDRLAMRFTLKLIKLVDIES